MSCVGCGFENREDAAFCGECGRSLAPEINCPSCARPNPEGRKFCDGCGARLLAAAHEPPRTRSAPAAPAVARSPRDYTPRHLADKILRSKSALEGERKRVTVLFADVKGSMELSESVDPERWHGILDRFFQILTDGVHRFEGTVNQYTGDGIMALFGAPIAHEDHAQRACYAALHLRDALRGYAQELRREHGLDFATRIGLNSGDVVVGKIGDDLRMDYTAQGHTVGLAQRMESLAEAGAIYLSEATGKLVTGYFELEDLGEFNVKGSGAPLRVHSLLGIGRLRTRLDLSRSRGLSRFVGRAEELARLEAALERADAGQAQVVGIVADAGTGKSRLCFEFAEACRARGQTILEAYAPPHGKNVPLLPVLQLLRSAFGIEERDSAESARDKIAGRVVLRDESLTRALPLLFDLLGVADPSKPPIDAPPELREREIMNVIRSLLRSRSAQRVGTILIEDLHWLDPGSESFLAGIVEAVVGTRTLLVLNFRPEYRAAWMGKSYYQQIALQPLGPRELAEMLRDLLGDDSSLLRLSDRILRHTGGNPFFIEEVVRSLKESGVLEGERGAYRLIGQIDQLEIPASVQGILAARIDALSERDKHVLQTAAVIGATVGRPLLEAVVELPESALDESLRQLVGCELLYESALYPEPELSFKHALTRDVAYASLLGERRADLHAAVADALAALEPERLDENAALLAHHREQAGQKLEAARAHERAAIHAGMRRTAESLRHSSRVVELVGELPESEESRALGVTACARVLFRSGPHEAQRSSELFARARIWAEHSADPSLLAQLNGGYAFHLYNLGRYDESVSLLHEATRRVAELERPDLALGLVPRLTVALFAAGKIGEALEVFSPLPRALDTTGEAGDALLGVRPLGPGYTFHAVWLAEAGRVREAQQSLERGFEIVQAYGDPAELSLAELNAAILDEQRGTAQAALAHWARVDEIGVLIGRGPAVALAQLGRWGEVELAAQRCTEQMPVPFRAWSLPAVARARLELGDPQGAERILLEQITDAPARGARLEEIRAQLALARVLSRSAGAAARERIERALARVAELIERTGARLHLGALAEERACMQHALGDERAERAALIEAQRLYTEMGATGHAERIAAELGA